MIDNDEHLLFVRYWAKRIELDALAASEGILADILPAHMRRALTEAALQIAGNLRGQITAYERSKPRDR